MANYKESAISGTKWIRSNRVSLDNPYQGIPSILFDEEQITVAQGARMAGMSLSAFIDLLGSLQIPVTRLGAGELEREVAAFE